MRLIGSARAALAAVLLAFAPAAEAGEGAFGWLSGDWYPVTASVFGEYSRLTGPAADSSLVGERGDRDQFLFGLSATYRFDFTL